MCTQAPDPDQRAREFFFRLLDDYGSYDARKEAMANVAIAIYFGAIGGILLSSEWPWNWFVNRPLVNRLSALIAVVFVFLVALWFIQWQLEKRRTGAIYVAAIQKLLAEHLTAVFSESDLKKGSGGSPCKSVSICQSMRKWIWPTAHATLHGDVLVQSYPACLQKALTDQTDAGTDAIRHERVILVLVWGLFVVAFIRTLFAAC